MVRFRWFLVMVLALFLFVAGCGSNGKEKVSDTVVAQARKTPILMVMEASGQGWRGVTLIYQHETGSAKSAYVRIDEFTDRLRVLDQGDDYILWENVRNEWMVKEIWLSRETMKHH